ncbi:hypothetical protein RchiOBHm_Chr2g0089011 [Rosa chinensis]|uniref:DUF4283 domain-containing protein n=1 Tax=Rosa chinensis TaxID=74649 RepID=A0A2P6RJ58_ROSCH|nr:hypothetical protein RchiOBHm_Chr2g0089011 [Rosa chinensis]
MEPSRPLAADRIVKFTLESDLNVALCGGPWILAGQTLVVQKWRPNFDPNNEKINNMAVWVRILGVPVRYFKDYTLKVIFVHVYVVQSNKRIPLLLY